MAKKSQSSTPIESVKHKDKRANITTKELHHFMPTASVALQPAKNLDQLKKRLNVSLADIIEFCQRWKINELALFGSILREDFNADSDIDFLVTFAPDANIGLFELYHIEEELKLMLGRDVDVVSKQAIQRSHNWIRRRNILGNAEVLYVTR